MEYYALIEPAEEGGYTVTFPDVPAAITEGDTLEEALANAAEVLNGVLEYEFERGYEPPARHKHRGKHYHAIAVSPRIELAWRLREMRGKTPQEAIAAKLGISQQAYAKMENPRTCNPTVRTLEKVSRAMGRELHIDLS